MARSNIYTIPENFIEGGKIINGMFKTRNFIEAVVLSLLIGIPLWFVQYPSVRAKITVLALFVLPVFMIAVAGINDNSLIEFVQQFTNWRKKKRIMLYNAQARSRAVRPSEVVLAQEMPKDKLVKTIDNWKENRRKKNSQISFVEGIDFEFTDDEEFNSAFISTEKKILGEDDDTPKHEKKKKKERKHKNKKPLLLNAGTSDNEIHDNSEQISSYNEDITLDIKAEDISVEGFDIENVDLLSEDDEQLFLTEEDIFDV